MNEIYWLTRVSTINDIGGIMAAVSAICLAFSPVLFMVAEDDLADWIKPRVMIKWLISMFITGLLIIAFVPTRKDLYLIYGLGTVIDYAKGNEKVKEIPDKAVEAIIEWMEVNKDDKGYKE